MSADHFLLISDPAIWSMKVTECHEPLVDLKDYHCKISPNRAAFYTGYTKVRLTVAEKIMTAQQMLPNGLRFLFSEGHRPVTLQQQMFTDYYHVLANKHPDWDDATLKREVTKFIASPEDVPPHSTGGAIDITLIDQHGNELDMGSILDEPPEDNDNRNFTHANNLSVIGKANRQILINSLQQAGFVNYPAEWWHWSYGDKYWAYHAKQNSAIYGSVV